MPSYDSAEAGGMRLSKACVTEDLASTSSHPTVYAQAFGRRSVLIIVNLSCQS